MFGRRCMGVVYRGSIGHQGDEGDGIGQEVLPVAMGWFGRVLCICTVRIGIERREEKSGKWRGEA
jgi:hypothetical protein